MHPTNGKIDSLWRHPVKGFTPEPVAETSLTVDGFFPFDRLFALEVGPSGYDRDDPKFLSKMKYAVLARFPAVVRLRTRYDEITERLFIDDCPFDIAQPAGRHALERHIETMLAAHEEYDPVAQPLRFLDIRESAVDHYRFTDSSKGFVSILNLNSVRDLSARMGIDLDPLRLRANIWVEGWSAFEDHAWVGKRLRIGEKGPLLEVLKPILRCVATHVNPQTAQRDAEMVQALWTHYGHRDCGLYCRVVSPGLIRAGDAVDPQVT
ncbi:MOSC domain-containing protein [Asticcacaulis excentricus]|uniref:MOSC domain containing protein n=1 Tax=Asticcacaulis excentricus (strain ATCC 15261 / DSM 4724 / KCTC 12464 / NCIMB 9791 / VKM B-1370 / CB 48) TaxID=573065 RepID=E8RLA7_ASTEC|nr:MOSC domain-containing protein [Asticcacaulis excentricus]ADU12597.1 MOSC domain containing protein [Asticcacaulis excentricus CB 48]